MCPADYLNSFVTGMPQSIDWRIDWKICKPFTCTHWYWSTSDCFSVNTVVLSCILLIHHLHFAPGFPPSACFFLADFTHCDKCPDHFARIYLHRDVTDMRAPKWWFRSPNVLSVVSLLPQETKRILHKSEKIKYHVFLIVTALKMCNVMFFCVSIAYGGMFTVFTLN